MKITNPWCYVDMGHNYVIFNVGHLLLDAGSAWEPEAAV